MPACLPACLHACMHARIHMRLDLHVLGGGWAIVVAFLFVDAWVSNLLLKEFSGVTRGICKAASVAIVYLPVFM
ncbi:hypothetical protein AK812_SmicGene43571 [Symbiodinium microadriaticum]|uniref:Uncharacterized protein n=1 Tax=Symbiodinium microadriaticum TaxID=2951 RepID=A0A1Q9C0R4_SYMMI|nr:hypothetical protein AK812_SmicGene43571 [Symbiodinium microadriaticum]